MEPPDACDGYEETNTRLHGRFAAAVWRLLLERGANLEEQNTQGWRPLDIAICQHKLDIATCLIDANANVHAPSADLDGTYPIHLSASYVDRMPACSSPAQEEEERAARETEERPNQGRWRHAIRPGAVGRAANRGTQGG